MTLAHLAKSSDDGHHVSIGNITPADAYFGRDTAIIERRQKPHHPEPQLEPSTAGGLTANQDELEHFRV